MSRAEATGISYDSSRNALTRPGAVDNFFQLHRPESLDAMAAELSRLAYCDYGQILSGALARVNLSLVGPPFERDGTEAFLAEGADHAFLVFRGSDDLKAWILNIDARLQPWRGNGRVHSGFRDALDAVWSDVESRLRHVQRPLVITGHSQGAALATLSGALFPAAELITFGSPLVGDADFGQDLASARRYVNCQDIVCRLPHPDLPLLGGYQHVGQLLYLDSDGDISQPSDASIAEKIELGIEAMRESFTHLSEGRLPRRYTDHAIINYMSALR